MPDIDDIKPTHVQYLKQTLPGGREVMMGYNVDQPEDRGYFFKFMCEGRETKLRLSEVALAAVMQLKLAVDMHRDVGEVAMWVRVQDAVPSGLAEAT